MATLLLGIDVGTSGVKCVLTDDSGRVRGSATSEYSFDTPRAGWAEQDPHSWWLATIASLRQVLDVSRANPTDIAAIGLTGQMHGLVLLDSSSDVIRPCIMWNDQRSAPQCSELESRIGLKTLIEWTGNRLLPGFTAPKIAWVRRAEPESWSRTRMMLLPKDYLRFRLGGAFATEASDASGTLLFDCRNRRWSSQMLAALEIDPKLLPACTEATEVSSRLSAEAASLTGLREGTPIVGGGGDQAAQAVGAGITRQGLVSATLGTSGVVFAASDSFCSTPDGSLHAFCHAVPNRWHVMGVMLSAAGSFGWFLKNVALDTARFALEQQEDPYEILTEEAATVAPGCEGLIFLPYLSGERCPYADPDVRGSFIGLSTLHRRPHLTRAVLEGVTMGMLDCLDLVRGAGVPVDQVRLSGGGARSPFWRQLCADFFGVPAVTVNTTEGAAFGAALLAGVGAGVFASVDEACSTCVREVDRLAPGPQATALSSIPARFRRLYQTLAPTFSDWARHSSA